MPTLAFRLVARRYHATPWGHLANEGLVEWPPSPWRIIRALVAVGFMKHGWPAMPGDARRLVETLASVDPLFQLPRAAASHTRHWMPVGDQKTRVLDPFLVVNPSQPILVHFPCAIDEQLISLLARLAAGVSYLGRAESWVNADIVRSAPDLGTPDWCRPLSSSDRNTPAVHLLAPMSSAAYAEWRTKLRQGVEESSVRRRARVPASVPADLIECLLMDTAQLQRDGWSSPPGTRWVMYTRPKLEVVHPKLRGVSKPTLVAPATAVLLAVTPTAEPGRDGRRGVRPPMSRTVPQTELLHQSAVRALGEEARGCSSLSGRAQDGSPIKCHSHAHYLPLDLDADHRIDHVLVYAPGGLDERAQVALGRVQQTWTKRQIGRLVVRMVGRGSIPQVLEHLGAEPRFQQRLGVLGRGRVWTSVTPFVPPRHLKRTRHTVEDQVRAELESRGLPAADRVELLEPWELVQRRLFGFVLARREGKPQPPARVSFGLRLTFADPVGGPIALGYASHFGLGLFEVEETLRSGT